MAATQHAFLRILGHVGDFARVLAWRSHIDERTPRLRECQRVFVECANLRILTLCGYRIDGPRRRRFFTGEWPVIRFPFVAPAIENLHLRVTEKPKDPKGVAGP